MLISNISEKTELLQFDYCSGFFDLLLHLFGFFLCYAFFDGLGCAVNEFLSFFESEAGDFADNFDYADFVGAVVFEDYVKFGLLFFCCGCCCACCGVNG